MPDMSSCLLEGYNVLPSSPTGLRYSNLQHNFVILHWDPPAKHGDSSFEYEVVAQKVGPAPGPVITYTQVKIFSTLSLLKTTPYFLSTKITLTFHFFYLGSFALHIGKARVQVSI